MNSPAPEIAIYSSAFFHYSGVYRLRMHSVVVLHEQTARIAATRLVLTEVILNTSETSGSLSNGRKLKMYSQAVYKKSF